MNIPAIALDEPTTEGVPGPKVLLDSVKSLDDADLFQTQRDTKKITGKTYKRRGSAILPANCVSDALCTSRGLLLRGREAEKKVLFEIMFAQ